MKARASKRGGEVEVEEDLEFQRREWIVQRVGWGAIAFFVLAALLGLFGDGLLSATEAVDPATGLRVEYQRFIRAGARNRLTIHATRSPSQGLDIQLDRPYFDTLQIDRIVPEPQSITIGIDAVTLRFPAASSDPITIIMDTSPKSMGRQSTRLRVMAGGEVSLSQFAYF